METAELLERLRGAVAAARDAGVDDVEVSHASGRLGITRFANSYFTQAGVVEDSQTRVRVSVDGGRIGAALTSGLEPERLAETAKQAVEIAHLRPLSEDFEGFAQPDPARPVDTGAAARGFVEATVRFGPAERADLLARIFARASRDRCLCAGAYVNGPREVAVVTAAGVACHQSVTEANLELIALDGDASGFAAQHSPDVALVDGDALAEIAVGKVARARAAIDIEPGAYDVVLAPQAVAELLEWMAMTSFGASSVLDGTSLLCGNEGKKVTGAEVTIVDDWRHPHPGALPVPFDTEGTARSAVPLIERGVARRPVTDLVSAVKLGDERGSTGHAPGLGEDLTEGPMPANLVMMPGDRATEDLVAAVERGLYVTRFHYVNGLLDTRRATMTGMTRDGTFVIEKGRMGAGVKNLRFTESILDAFGRLGGIGRDLTAVPTHWATGGVYLCPPVLVRGFHFTGKSR